MLAIDACRFQDVPRAENVDLEPHCGIAVSDGQPAANRRVQVSLSRDSTIEAVVYSSNLTLNAQGLTKFEAS